jgi:hypothetical protein
VQLLLAKLESIESRIDDLRDDVGGRLDALAVKVDKTNGRVTEQERAQIRADARLTEVEKRTVVIRKKLRSATTGKGAPFLTVGGWRNLTKRVAFWAAAVYGAVEIGIKIVEVLK